MDLHRTVNACVLSKAMTGAFFFSSLLQNRVKFTVGPCSSARVMPFEAGK